MKIGVQTYVTAYSLDPLTLGKALEEAGFDSYWAPEHATIPVKPAVPFPMGGGEIPAIGDIQAMVPRNRAEVRIGALLSVNAGVVEELVFRLALPALLYGAFGSVEFALITSALVFGGLHAYQGPVGIIGTTIIGLLLLALYIASGSILLPIIAHALIDLRTFVQIPLIVLRVPAAPTPRSATTGARAR